MSDFKEIDELLIKSECNLLNEDEKKRLEELLHSSQGANKVLELHEDINQAFKYPEDLELGHRIDIILGHEKRRRLIKIYSRIAAVIILSLGLTSLYLWFPRGESKGEKLFAEYYITPKLADKRALAPSENILFEQVIESYNQKDYLKCDQLLNRLISSDSINSVYLLYEGICLVHLDQTNKAIERFEMVIKLDRPLTKESAMWFASLCYLKTNNEQKAKKILEELKLLNGSYANQAERVLHKINVSAPPTPYFSC